MEKEYNIIHNITESTHIKFDKECLMIDINNFRNNKFMKAVVQNCSKDSGILQLHYIYNNFKTIFDNINFELIKKFDSIGGNDSELILGLTPKVFSYIRESIIFCKYYLETREIKQIDNLLVIGAGYGLECCILHYICKICGIEIKKINCIDMPNVSKLQNIYFEAVGMQDICRSYSSSEYNEIPDIVYSNCCLAELTCEINYDYYSRFLSKSKGFYIVWGLWAANIPKYYIPYIVYGLHEELINDGLAKNTNAIIVK